MQVFVLGMHRSGTSALARVLNLMGLYFGEENASTGRSAENEKGFWERRDAMMINDSILFTANCDWDLVSKFDADMIPAATNARHKSAIADVVMKLDAHRPWFLKEPRLCVTFPIWRETLEQPICIHISRNPLEVAHSLKARNRIPIRVGLALWEFYTTRALQAASGLPLLCVSYEDLVGAPDRTVDSIRVFLGEQGGYPLRTPSTSELSGFLDANLRHHQKRPVALSRVATAHQLDLYRLLSSRTLPVSEPSDVSSTCLNTLMKYETTANVDDRRRLAKQRRMQRRRSHMELQITLREVELRHALDAERRLEPKVARLQDVRRKLEAQLAASNERVRTLGNDKTALQQKTANYEQLVTRHEHLKQDLGQRRQRNAELETRSQRLERELRELQLEHAESLHDGRRNTRELRAVRRKNAELHTRQLRAERELHQLRRLIAALKAAQSSADQKRRSNTSPVGPKGTDDARKRLTVPDASSSSSVTPAASQPPIAAGSVDVVVCVHNALEYVQRCLASVLSKSTVQCRVVIVNDGSDQPTTEWLQGLSARVDFVDLVETHHGPLGYTRAANLGLRATQADYVVLLNSDTIVPRLWLEGLLECMASDDKVGIVGPLSNAATWQSVPERVDENGGWAVNQLPGGYNVDEFAELVFGVSERQFPRVPFLNGFCLLISRAVIDQIGYLDETSFPRGYGEENDYCIRAQDAGFRLAIADHCFVYHAKSKSFGTSARAELAKAGGIALREKFGEERIRQGTQELKDSSSLERVRNAVRNALR